MYDTFLLGSGLITDYLLSHVCHCSIEALSLWLRLHLFLIEAWSWYLLKMVVFFSLSTII